MITRFFSLLTVVSSLSFAGTMTDADAEFAHFNYDGAIVIYEAMLAESPADPDLLWRLSRVYVCLGDVSTSDRRESLYRRAEQYARACVNLEPKSPDGHAWLAASLGSTAMFVGSKTKVALSREIKRELDLALKLDPNNEIALSILGSFYRALGNVSWIERQLADLLLGGLPDGGFVEGEAAFKRAIAISPSSVRHRFELAMLYRESGQGQLADELMRESLNLRPQMLSDVRRLNQMKSFLAASR